MEESDSKSIPTANYFKTFSPLQWNKYNHKCVYISCSKREYFFGHPNHSSIDPALGLGSASKNTPPLTPCLGIQTASKPSVVFFWTKFRLIQKKIELGLSKYQSCPMLGGHRYYFLGCFVSFVGTLGFGLIFLRRGFECSFPPHNPGKHFPVICVKVLLFALSNANPHYANAPAPALSNVRVDTKGPIPPYWDIFRPNSLVGTAGARVCVGIFGVKITTVNSLTNKVPPLIKNFSRFNVSSAKKSGSLSLVKYPTPKKNYPLSSSVAGWYNVGDLINCLFSEMKFMKHNSQIKNLPHKVRIRQDSEFSPTEVIRHLVRPPWTSLNPLFPPKSRRAGCPRGTTFLQDGRNYSMSTWYFPFFSVLLAFFWCIETDEFRWCLFNFSVPCIFIYFSLSLLWFDLLFLFLQWPICFQIKHLWLLPGVLFTLFFFVLHLFTKPRARFLIRF